MCSVGILLILYSLSICSIGAGSFIGVEPINSAVIAGALAVSRVITDLAKAFLDDGKLTQEEVDAIFKKANKKEDTK